MALGLVLSRVLYLRMAVLMLVMACLAVILYASALAVLPMVVKVSIHCVCSVSLVGSGGRLIFSSESNVEISGWFRSCVWEWWHATWMALRMLWCVLRWDFHIFCCFLGRNPPWSLALCGSGGVGWNIHVVTEGFYNFMELGFNVLPLLVGKLFMFQSV
jgi:hypothetical protein